LEETRRLLDALKRQLRAREITYAALGKKIGLSESSVKRLFASGSFTLTRLERVCGVLQMTVADLVRGNDVPQAGVPATLSHEQERVLASDAGLLACFYLLLNGHTIADCARRLNLTARALQSVLKRLGQAGLVSRSSKEVRLTAKLPIAWRMDGPVRRLYERQVRAEFLQSPFTEPGEALAFHSAELSSASLRVLGRKLERLSAEVAELAALDVSLPSREKTSVGMLVALRPWVFSMFANYHVRPER
jgi:DNA-binding Lrp family transcriptional regulator